MPNRSSRTRSDLKTLTSRIVAETRSKEPVKNPAAVALGRLGGKKGGPARAAALTKKRRTAIAKKAARARWATKA